MISISVDHNLARLQGTKSFIDTGSGVAYLYLYSTARVADNVDPGAPLARIPLDYPCGTLTEAGLELQAAGDGIVFTSGDALWGRICNRDGAHALSADVRIATDAPEVGEIVVAQRAHLAGGAARMVSGVLG